MPGQMFGPTGVLPAGGGGGAGPTVDATATGTTGAGNTSTVTITTTQANCLIFVCYIANFVSATGLTSVNGSTLGAFTKRFDASVDGVWGGNGGDWWKLRPTAGTETVTITYNGTISFSQVAAISVAGANTSAPFNVTTLVLGNGLAAGGSGVSITTTAANQLLINFARINVSSETVDSGWTAFCNTNFERAEYKASTTTGSQSISDPVNGTNGLLMDAITA